jgi:RimJ/RimL family protein N-acetyltransferase
MLGCPERRFWYVVEDANVASIRVIEKAGFILTGIGKRVPRLGIGLLGYYVIEHESSVAPPVRPFPTLRLQ